MIGQHHDLNESQSVHEVFLERFVVTFSVLNNQTALVSSHIELGENYGAEGC